MKTDFCHPESTLKVVGQMSQYVGKLQTLIGYFDSLLSVDLKSRDDESEQTDETTVRCAERVFQLSYNHRIFAGNQQEKWLKHPKKTWPSFEIF